MRFLSLALVAAVCVPAAFAQNLPKVDPKPYVDNVDLGFSVKVPKDWEFVPAQFQEAGNLVGSYSPKSVKYAMVDGLPFFFDAWLVKFDRRPKESSSATTDAARIREAAGRGVKDFATWAKSFNQLGQNLELEEDDKFTAGKLKGREYIYTAKTPRGLDVKIWAVILPLSEDVDVGLVFRAPADKKKFGKWKSGLRKFAKSFKPVKLKEVESSGAVEGESALRTAKRMELEGEVAKQPGWELHETPNYFIITSSDDRAFIKDALARLEAIREVYVEDYPLDKAEAAYAARKLREEEKRRKDAEEDGEDPDKGRSTVAQPNPQDQARCSVVRICKSRDQYIEYGGSPRSAGYWNFVAEELVLYDDKAMGGRENTWAVLNHEAFHQYIFYFYGSLSPHSWYNEGTGDFYSGYKLNSQKKFVLERFEWRDATIKEEIKVEKTFPLERLVRMTQGEYYSSNELGNSRYPQGWSFIYFLRTGKDNRAKGWQDEWGDILGMYLDTLAATGDLNKAVDTAFAGVDYTEIEEAWKEYTLKGK